MEFKVLTYNMHKGRSFWLRDYCIRHIREQIKTLAPDIVFLQEIPGVHPKNFEQVLGPAEYLADSFGGHYCYGKNAIYQNGHHGNAIISNIPLSRHLNMNISETKLAVRGLLHAEVELPSPTSNTPSRLHLLNVHLDLFEMARQRQAAFILNYIKREIAADEPLILAGDFNDWRGRLDKIFEPYLTRAQSFSEGMPKKLNTSPSLFPMYDLDRIYSRNITFSDLHVEHSTQWVRLSDHLPLLGRAQLA